MRIILSSANTAGHVYPFLALAAALKKQNSQTEILFIGSEKGLDAKVIPAHGFAFKAIHTQGWQGRNLFNLFESLFYLLRGFLESILIFLKFKPDLVFSIGSHTGLAVSLAAFFLLRPLIIFEPNATAGLVNKICSFWAKKIALGFNSSGKFFPKNKIIFSGCPVREEFFSISKEEAVKNLNLDLHKRTILTFGGSQGASVLNEIVFKALAHLLEKNNFQVIHITGEKEYLKYKNQEKDNYHLFPYLENIAHAFVASDLIISRAGASTIAEIIAAGKPSILIPYPFASESHQEHNAQELVQQGAAMMISQKELRIDLLEGIIKKILDDQILLERMQRNCLSLGKRDAHLRMMELIEKI